MTLGIPEWWLGLRGWGGRGGGVGIAGDGLGGREGNKMDTGMRGIGKAEGQVQ